MSVVVTGFAERVNSEGKPFIALIVNGELEIVKSANGNFYATSRKASIPSTVDKETAKMMLGKELNGSIAKEECEPYETVNSDGELVTLNHRYTYVPESSKADIHADEVLDYAEMDEELVH